MIEPEFIDDENIPLLERDENIDDSVYEDSQTETSFNDVIQQEANEIELENLDTEINALERGFNVKICLLYTSDAADE